MIYFNRQKKGYIFMKQDNYNKNKRLYKQLSHSERIKIKQLYDMKLSYAEIGRRISRDKSTIMREIKRNGKMNQPSLTALRKGIKPYRYTSKKAQNKRDMRFERPKSYKKYNTFIEYVNTNITPQTSLEDLYFNFLKYYSGTPCPCLKSIYNWAHKQIIKYPWGDKVVKSPRQKSNKEPIEGRKSIHQRKEDFNFDIKGIAPPRHFEIDTIYDEDKKGGALTFNDKYNMKLYSVQLSNRKASTTNKALRQLIDKIGPHNILSITSDNGVEFAYSKVIEVYYNLKWYYCDPYSSWQRGQNERLNRDIRKYIPKGQSIKKLSQRQYDKIIAAINNKPRRKFGGLSSNEYSSVDAATEPIGV